MCGIAGALGLSSWPKREVLKQLEHRGPDSNGFFEEGNIFLGHCRLAILDLSSNGAQPMFSADERFQIIFNGEIYNHLEIRENLHDDFTFKSTSDTETLLYAYIKFGEACLSMLNGIFAFAIYDKKLDEIFIARDPLGVKPLYYYRDNEKFLFSSELKSFLDFPIDKSISAAALANYLTFLWSPGEKTPFLNVKKLEPGHYLKFKAHEFREANPIKYYQIDFNGTYLDADEEKLVDLLEERLIKAVERQMLADVPVGFFLSGGLDSSLLVAIARRRFPDKILPCFTIESKSIVGSEGVVDDLRYAKTVAKHLNVDLTIVPAEINIIEDFDKMIWHLDEPQADAAPLNVLNICTVAKRKGIKVMIGGTGGDDIFSGYRRHLALNYEKFFNAIPETLHPLLKYTVKKIPLKTASARRLKKLFSDIDKSTIERMTGYFSWLPQTTMKSLFSQPYRQIIENYSPADLLKKLNQDIPDERNLMNQMLYWELKSFLPDHNLNYTDKLAMAVGVEARVPYLDVELVQFSTRIPPSLKLKNGITKYILKKVAERYLPHDVIYRPKTGFGAPIRYWITTEMEMLIQERLAPDNIRRRGIFDAEAVWKLIADNKNGKVDASYPIWCLLAIESWMLQFVDNVKLT